MLTAGVALDFAREWSHKNIYEGKTYNSAMLAGMGGRSVIAPNNQPREGVQRKRPSQVPSRYMANLWPSARPQN